jgi:hypothetical protein
MTRLTVMADALGAKRRKLVGLLYRLFVMAQVGVLLGHGLVGAKLDAMGALEEPIDDGIGNCRKIPGPSSSA